MVEYDIEKIRKDAIAEIKEKVKKNPGYLRLVNKERQEDMKRLQFSNGYDFTCWMKRNRIMKNSTDIRREEIENVVKNSGCKNRKEYLDKCAQSAGFKDYTERKKELMHESVPPLRELNEDCSVYFGEFTENLMIQT